ncbi:MAG TPA: peptidase dimerization domain-containing protein, partial [Gemmatimonadota bacterium]|nr:peptidase dimerization domain-containing protein [Gemmatimonadota bacterium]
HDLPAPRARAASRSFRPALAGAGPLAALAAAALLAAAPARAAAQATDTERQAAADVLARIDSLESVIRPTETAQRLADRKDAGRDAVLARVEALWNDSLQDLSDWIGHHPEVGWHEFASVDTLTAVLEEYGFDVKTGVADMPTAFVATWTSPAGADGPTLGLIGEYDALRGTKGDFHGDQHNAQTPVAMAAARALAERMASAKIPGKIVIFGTPAEETDPPAKTILERAGIFEGTDILVRSHSLDHTQRARPGFGVCCLNIDAVKYIFSGQPAHELASWHGRNALEAAVQFYSAVDHLRSTWRPEHRVQGIIPEGGAAPNVVPDRAVVDYFVRYPDDVYLEHIARMMRDAAQGAALMTGTEVQVKRYGEFRDGVTTASLEELFWAYANKLDAPGLVPEKGRPAGYEETGWVSRDIPGVGITVRSSSHANHTYGMLEDDFQPIGHTGFLLDAKIEAAILYDFLTQPDFRRKVKEEHRVLAGLQDRYEQELRRVYAPEIGADTALSRESRMEMEIPDVERPEKGGS